MGIKLSEKAAQEVKRILQEQSYGPETVLRVGVTGGGCSGFSYALGFDNSFDEQMDAKTRTARREPWWSTRKATSTSTARRSISTKVWKSVGLPSKTRMPSNPAAAVVRFKPDVPWPSGTTAARSARQHAALQRCQTRHDWQRRRKANVELSCSEAK